MTAGERGKSGRQVPANSSDPSVLLLSQALRHLTGGRLPGLILGTLGWLAVAAVVGAFGASGAMVAGLVAGWAGAYVLIALLYLCWYARFAALNQARGCLCPGCTSRIWQFCCSRCQEPVPPLACWLSGTFLAHCPHCGQHLSARSGTLLAWCSTCSSSFERPAKLLSKPNHVIVWVVIQAPDSVGDGWIPADAAGAPERLFFHWGDKHSASALCLVTDYQGAVLPIPDHLRSRVRFLLVDDDIQPLEQERLRQLFHPPPISGTVGDSGAITLAEFRR